MIPEITFWERGKEDAPLPQQLTFKLVNNFLQQTISNYERSIKNISDPTRLAVVKKTLLALKKELDNSKELTITFVPLLNYELRNIIRPRISGMAIGCEGLPVNDLDADICASHCLVPKYSYDEWVYTKDNFLKIAIARKIYDNSFPPESEEEKELKKKVKMLMGQESK